MQPKQVTRLMTRLALVLPTGLMLTETALDVTDAILSAPIFAGWLDNTVESPDRGAVCQRWSELLLFYKIQVNKDQL